MITLIAIVSAAMFAIMLVTLLWKDDPVIIMRVWLAICCGAAVLILVGSLIIHFLYGPTWKMKSAPWVMNQHGE